MLSEALAGELKLTWSQFWRYVVIGLMNTAIDFAVLNLLSWMTGIYKGNGLIPINFVSFSAAIINSYYFNRIWSFDDKTKGEHGKKFSLFLLISIGGAIINTAVLRLISTEVHPFHGLSPQAWLNVSKLMATCVIFLWNFTGYKLVVFKK